MRSHESPEWKSVLTIYGRSRLYKLSIPRQHLSYASEESAGDKTIDLTFSGTGEVPYAFTIFSRN